MIVNDEHPSPPAAEAPPPAGPASDYHVAQSVEPTKRTYLIRRSLLGGSLLAVIVAALVVTGSLSLPGTDAVDSGSLVNVPGQSGQPVDSIPAGGDAVDGTAGGGAQPDPGVPVTEPPAVDNPAADAQTVDDPAPGDTDQPVESGLPARTSRLVAQAAQRVLDTRGGDLPTPGTALTVTTGPTQTAVAVSVTVLGTAQAGAVIADGGAGPVTVTEIGGSGASVTNLIVLPIINGGFTVQSTAGGHLVVDIVGGFEESGETNAGRFVPVDDIQVARLETAVDGQETDLALQTAVPADAEAVLVRINADVGADGGRVLLGQADDQYDQMLMWGPAADGNVQRRGLVLLQPSELGNLQLRYDGGSVLTAEVVGYFTGQSASTAAAGLYVPSGPRTIHEGPATPGTPITADGIEPSDGIALVSTAASAGPGEVGLSLAPVTGGTVTISDGLPVTDGAGVVVTLLGVFLA